MVIEIALEVGRNCLGRSIKTILDRGATSQANATRVGVIGWTAVNGAGMPVVVEPLADKVQIGSESSAACMKSSACYPCAASCQHDGANKQALQSFDWSASQMDRQLIDKAS